MNIGFVGIILGDSEIKMKSCRLKNASESRLREIISFNLNTLDLMLDYLIKNEIRLFRISSDIIPFGSHPANNLNWQEEFKEEFKRLGKKAIKNNIRLSMHPGQYTILSSQNESLTLKSFQDLIYHSKVLDLMNLPPSHKLILHIGGVYNDKQNAMNTFIKNYSLLPKNIKRRLVIENDDRCYTASDVLEISKKIKCPVVFDYLHYLLNHYEHEQDPVKMLQLCRDGWNEADGTQKIHYSQQAENKKLGSHSDTIDPIQFHEFSKILPKDIDVMFEVKDKNLSVLKYKNFLESL